MSGQVTSSLEAYAGLALNTIRRNVRRFRDETVVQPSPTYQGFWARDTMIVVLGLLDSGQTDLAAALLRTWASYQIRETDDPAWYVLLNKHRLNWSEAEVERPDAEWLRENRGGLETAVYVGRDTFPDGTREIYSCHPDPDSTAWWLIAWSRYVMRTGDTSLAADLRSELQAALDALVRRDSDGDLLIEQCPNEDWADHWRRHGKVAYTQAVWYGAAQAGTVLDLSGPDPSAIREAIRSELFTRYGRPIDWKCPRARSNRLAQDSALLVLMDVLDPDEGRLLMRRLDCLAGPHGHRVIAPGFRSSSMGPHHFKIGEYQNAAIWSWLSGWEAQARAKVGQRDGALDLISGCFCPGCDRIYEWVDPQSGGRYNPDFATGAGSVLSAIARLEAA